MDVIQIGSAWHSFVPNGVICGGFRGRDYNFAITSITNSFLHVLTHHEKSPFRISPIQNGNHSWGLARAIETQFWSLEENAHRAIPLTKRGAARITICFIYLPEQLHPEGLQIEQNSRLHDGHIFQQLSQSQ